MERSKAFADALQLFVGQGRSVTVPDLAAASGVSERLIYAYRANETPPSWANALAIIRVMPAEFAAMALREAAVVSVRKAEDPDPCPFKLSSEIGDTLSRLLKMLEDRKIDHREEPVLDAILVQLQAVIDRYRSASKQLPEGVVRIPREGRVQA